MVEEGGFSLSILAPGARPSYQDSQQSTVSLPSGTEYSIQLSNNRSTRCDVEVHIDGDRIGEWKLLPYSSAVIEHGVNNSRHFLFVADGGVVGRTPGQRGLVTAIFKPEKERHSPTCVNCGESISAGYASRKSGITIEGDRSNQHFSHGQALSILDVDWNSVRELSIRLVVRDRYFDGRVD